MVFEVERHHLRQVSLMGFESFQVVEDFGLSVPLVVNGNRTESVELGLTFGFRPVGEELSESSSLSIYSEIDRITVNDSVSTLD